MDIIRSVVAGIALLVASSFLAVPLHTQAAQSTQGRGGFGIYPSVIEWNDVVRGSEYFSDVVVLNGQDVDLNLSVSDGRMFLLSGSERIGEPNNTWVTIHPVNDRTRQIDSITAPANSEARVVLRARVPPDAANGTYIGTVYFHAQRALPGSAITGSGASVTLGVATDVKLVVKGAQRLSGAVTDVYVTDSEASYPLRLTTTFHNTGNVVARPQIDLSVKNAAGQPIGRAQFADWSFDPGENRSVSSDWDTTGVADGEYIAAVKVSLAGESIYERDLGFKILPRGTITRMGSLERLALEEMPRPGAVGRAVATFYNIGRIDSRTKFVGELYRGSTRIDTVSSEEKLVPYGEKADLEMFIRVSEAGEYTLRGKVNYEGKETETKEVDFVVSAGPRIPLELPLAVAIVIALSVFAAGAFAINRKKSVRPSPKLSKLSS